MTDGGCRYRLFPGWCPPPMGGAVLRLLRRCFTYTGAEPGRATGYLYDEGGPHPPGRRARDWPAPLAAVGPGLLAALENDLGVRFAVCAFQAYTDGAGCDWHADSDWAAQAIVSLGVTRSFALRSGGGTRTRLRLHHGDLLYLPAAGDGWEHCVPVEDVAGERCSLVFRTGLEQG